VFRVDQKELGKEKSKEFKDLVEELGARRICQKGNG